MVLTPRRAVTALAFVGLVTAAPRLASAQLRDELAVIGAPSVTSYGFGAGAAKRAVSQRTVPFVVLLPISERLSMDLSTAFATSEVSVKCSGTP